MLKIRILRENEVLHFAAQELKKYYRMMMPEENSVVITTDPNAKEGFRLGLLEDFGLDCNVKDPYFDDLVHVDADHTGGILAGSNERSVLFAVYRFLKLNGCRWFFPGPEGEDIPVKRIEKQFYHKAPDHRYRGHTLEGRPSLRQTLDYIDFHAKQELNAFGLYGVADYHVPYYYHRFNRPNFPEEGFDPGVAETQWRARYECELFKRGQILFSGEHDLIPEAIGLEVKDRRAYKDGTKQFPEEIKQYLALVNGKREFVRNDINFTQLCYSNPEVQRRIVESAAKMVKKNQHLDFFGITFADLHHNHCQCEQCLKSRPADKYVRILNRIDEKLTQEGVKTKILFSFYTDMMFAPMEEKIQNPDRFIFQFCPMRSSYSSSITGETVLPAPIPYRYNDWKNPEGIDECLALFRQWEKVFAGPCAVFEYHFWRPQYKELGGAIFARRVYEDTRAYQIMGMHGCMEDGSMKSFFPNGFADHMYSKTLYDRDVDFEAELEDYYSHLYGKNWQLVYRYQQEISDAFDFAYMQREKSVDPEKGAFYNPGQAEKLAQVKNITQKIRKAAQAGRMLPKRHQAIAWSDLVRHADWCDGVSEAMMEKCCGNDQKAIEIMDRFVLEFGKRVLEIDDRFDFVLAVDVICAVIKENADFAV